MSETLQTETNRNETTQSEPARNTLATEEQVMWQRGMEAMRRAKERYHSGLPVKAADAGNVGALMTGLLRTAKGRGVLPPETEGEISVREQQAARLAARVAANEVRQASPEYQQMQRVQAIKDAAWFLARDLRNAGVPPDYQVANFDARQDGSPLIITPQTRRAHDLCRSLAEKWKPGSRGIILHSRRCGTGKTYHACAVLRALAVRGASVQMLKTSQYLNLYRDSYNAKEGNGKLSSSDVRALYEKPNMLLLDELGGEKIAGGEDGDWARERILEMVDFRTTRGLTILATTNLTAAELERHYDERITSRLLGHAFFVPMDGPDHRTLGLPVGDDPFNL